MAEAMAFVWLSTTTAVEGRFFMSSIAQACKFVARDVVVIKRVLVFFMVLGSKVSSISLSVDSVSLFHNF